MALTLTPDMFLLIAYDIANKKRLYRVAKIMEDYGARVQRSVFECRIGEKELDALLEKVRPILKRTRIYKSA